MDNDNLLNFMQEVDSGAFAIRAAAYLKEVAQAVARHDKGGEIVIKFSIKPSKKTNQTGAGARCDVVTKLNYVRPTNNGKIAEENNTETPMWINKDGSVTLLAASHDDMFDGDKISRITK